MSKLSVIIITKNEEINIVDCINSCKFADEIIVIDSGSTDKTICLAKANGALVYEQPWLGYGKQKNIAIEHTNNEWVLSIDADERVTDELAKEIKNAISWGEFKVYEIPRYSLFVSKFMNHSGWQPDRVTRLFKKGFASFSIHQVHEHLATKHPIGRLDENIIHYSYRNFEMVLNKVNSYSTAGALDLNSIGIQGSLKKAFFHASWAFFRTYIIRVGFLDGKEGIMLAISNAEVTYYKYIKLLYIQKNNPHLTANNKQVP